MRHSRSSARRHVILAYRRPLIVAVHLCLWSIAWIGAFFLRFEFNIPKHDIPAIWHSLGIVLFVRTAIGLFSGTFHGLWRYTSMRHLGKLLVSTTLSSAIFAGALILAGISNLPQSVLVLDWFGALMLTGGLRVAVRALREGGLLDVSINDLLSREPVYVDDGDISTFIAQRCVMVTGAGGSIGAELCRQISGYGMTQLLLVERCENALFCIHRELTQHLPQVAVVPIVADVGDAARMEAVFQQYKPTVIFHAAAHKHVPLMESNVVEAVKNNVLATRQLADIAEAHAIRHFVFVSTDKAVNPSSIMGATKRAAELHLQDRAQRSPHIQWVIVRFGNVLGSNGSVVTIFKEQIAKGGPITITHPDMCRYFMTIPEACQLVLKAATLGRSGDIFTLDMGEPINILDLARDLVRLSGLTMYRDIEIVFTGIRPGEKLFEEVNLRTEDVAPTAHPQIFVGRSRSAVHPSRESAMHGLQQSVLRNDADDVLEHLQTVVPEYRMQQRYKAS